MAVNLATQSLDPDAPAVNRFTDLEDTPDDLTGIERKLLAVDSTGDDVRSVTLTEGDSISIDTDAASGNYTIGVPDDSIDARKLVEDEITTAHIDRQSADAQRFENPRAWQYGAATEGEVTAGVGLEKVKAGTYNTDGKYTLNVKAADVSTADLPPLAALPEFTGYPTGVIINVLVDGRATAFELTDTETNVITGVTAIAGVGAGRVGVTGAGGARFEWTRDDYFLYIPKASLPVATADASAQFQSLGPTAKGFTADLTFDRYSTNDNALLWGYRRDRETGDSLIEPTIGAGDRVAIPVYSDATQTTPIAIAGVKQWTHWHDRSIPDPGPDPATWAEDGNDDLIPSGKMLTIMTQAQYTAAVTAGTIARGQGKLYGIPV